MPSWSSWLRPIRTEKEIYEKLCSLVGVGIHGSSMRQATSAENIRLNRARCRTVFAGQWTLFRPGTQGVHRARSYRYAHPCLPERRGILFHAEEAQSAYP